MARISPELQDRLAIALADCRERVLDPPALAEVALTARELREAGAYLDAAVLTGLMTDEAVMAHVDSWPPEVVEAMQRLGLWDKYGPTTLHGILEVRSKQQIFGLVNTVKGAAFEQLSVDGLNAGDLGPLPDGGDHVQLASSLTQPGWDAEVVKDAVPVDYLQMKATSNWQVIAHHLARYPEYPDVVTTSEGTATAADHGMDAHHLIDTQISNLQLTDDVNGALEHLDVAHALHEAIPEVSIVVVSAIAAYAMARGADRRLTFRWARAQLTKSGVSNAAGVAASLLTGTTHIRIFASLGMRFGIDRAHVAKTVGERMHRHRDTLNNLVARPIAGSADDL